MTASAEAVICGAGIAGISAAYHLAAVQGVRRVVIVDERPPLSLTSDKSTECYRNWWPGPGEEMVRLMNRSIDLLDGWADQTGNRFHLNRRGYLFATADTRRIAEFQAAGVEAASLGAGPLRWHRGRPEDPPYEPASRGGYAGDLDGADLITDPGLLREHFPYLAPDTAAVVHARRCGWFSAQQLGAWLLERARSAGAELLEGRMTGVRVESGRVTGVRIDQKGTGADLDCDRLILAPGPFLPSAAAMLGLRLPVFAEWHAKVAMADPLGVMPRHAPLLIWSDPLRLEWTPDERAEIEASDQADLLLGEFPSGVHARPEGPEDSPIVLILWTYHSEPIDPLDPPPPDPLYPEIALRGLARMLPGLRAYFGHAPRPRVDGGFYLKTRENRPLIGPLPVDGSFVIGALSGFGLMASAAAGELVAAHALGNATPDYAAAFRLERYQDPEYRRLLETWTHTGQL